MAATCVCLLSVAHGAASCAGGSSSLRESVDLTSADIVFYWAAAPTREQKLASEVLLGMREELRTYVEGDGALLAICGGYQIPG